MSEGTPRTQPLREFFLARQPILNRKQDLIAYELLFRNADVDTANIFDDLSATASVISHTALLGIEKVVGNALGFVNVDAAVMMSDIFQILPREKMVLEIIETVEPTPEVIARIGQLVKEGFRFALDDVIADSPDIRALLPFVEFIKFDLRDMPEGTLAKLTPQFKQSGKKLLAEKVETIEQFNACLALGFDYFQGYYFAKPAILTGTKISPSQMSVMELMNLIVNDADNSKIERTIKNNAALGFNLLRLVNTPAFGIRRKIESLSQALLVLGREQLRRWLQIMLYAEPNRSGQNMMPLLLMATTRGKMLELMAQKIDPGNRSGANTAFTVGIMSLMDTLFRMPMKTILEQISVVDDVSNALLHRTGHYGDMLKFAESLERIEEAGGELFPMMRKLNLTNEDLYDLEIASFEWSNQVFQSVI